MFGKLMPRDENFFELFSQHADLAVKASHELVALMGDISQIEMRARAIDNFEKQADKITHTTIERLHKTFITPIDRDDIHKLITSMDDILDLTQDVAETISLYDIRTSTPEAQRLAEISLQCAEKVKLAVEFLSNMSNSGKILALCQEIDRLESEADHVMRSAMSKLFRDEPDTRQLIKFKALYELLETISDRSEDVANVIEGIVVENA